MFYSLATTNSNIGGAAACVAAGRLARADPTLSLLVVEGGKVQKHFRSTKGFLGVTDARQNNLNDPMVTTPAIYPSHLIPDSQNAIFYSSEKSEHLRGRQAVVVTGGALGGGSSINFMMYTRGQSCDYDSWQTEGWDFKSLLPYFKKVRRIRRC